MRRFLASQVLLLMVTACTGNTPAIADLSTAVPYQTAVATESATLLPPLEEILFPTPTTFTYMVVQGDTLNAIAGRFEVTLEALLSANPGIQPEVLSVGTTLIIPAGSILPATQVSTAVPLPTQQARCWPETHAGLWCFAQILNEYGESIENISAQFTLLDASGREIASQAAFALLDTLPSGQFMPLAVHFPPQQQGDVSIRVELLTAIRLMPGDSRYVPVMLENTLISVDASGRTALVSGRVKLNEAGPAGTLCVLGTAFDSLGNIIGIRKWESTTGLTSDESVSFEFMLSSVGPEIDRVEFLAEARP